MFNNCECLTFVTRESVAAALTSSTGGGVVATLTSNTGEGVVATLTSNTGEGVVAALVTLVVPIMVVRHLEQNKSQYLQQNLSSE